MHIYNDNNRRCPSSPYIFINDLYTLVDPASDFRQQDILKTWANILQDPIEKGASYIIARLRVQASSGFYARVLAHDLGHALGTQALAFNIIRTKVGNYSIPC